MKLNSYIAMDYDLQLICNRYYNRKCDKTDCTIEHKQGIFFKHVFALRVYN